VDSRLIEVGHPETRSSVRVYEGGLDRSCYFYMGLAVYFPMIPSSSHWLTIIVSMLHCCPGSKTRKVETTYAACSILLCMLLMSLTPSRCINHL
jgi:hypothetical protein